MNEYRPIRSATPEEIAAVSLTDQGSILSMQIGILETLLPKLVAQGKKPMWRAEHELTCLKAAYATVRRADAEAAKAKGNRDGSN